MLRRVGENHGERAEVLRGMAEELLRDFLNVPSYDGEFPGKMAAIGVRVHAWLTRQAERLEEASAFLVGKAEAFELADQEVGQSFHGVQAGYERWLTELFKQVGPYGMVATWFGERPELIPAGMWEHMLLEDKMALSPWTHAFPPPAEREGPYGLSGTLFGPRPDHIPEAIWEHLPLEDKIALSPADAVYPPVFGVDGPDGKRYVRVDLDQMNSVYYYDEQGNVVKTDLASRFGVPNMSGVIWIEYDYEEVTRTLDWSDDDIKQREMLMGLSDQELGIRLLIGEIGADRMITNGNALWESAAALETIENRIDVMSDPREYARPDGLIDADGKPPHWGGPGWAKDSEQTFSAVATAGGQYPGVRSARAIDPQGVYLEPRSEGRVPSLSEGELKRATDVAAVAYELVSSGQIEDITEGATEVFLGDPREVGAFNYAHRCGPPGTPNYDLHADYCDGKPKVPDRPGASLGTGPMVLAAFLDFDRGWVKEVVGSIDYVPIP